MNTTADACIAGNAAVAARVAASTEPIDLLNVVKTGDFVLRSKMDVDKDIDVDRDIDIDEGMLVKDGNTLDVDRI